LDVEDAPAKAPRSEPIRVVVVDDQELFRRGLIMLLGVEADIKVVGEAGDGISAAALVASVVPDIVLLDVRMPKRTGLEACIEIKQLVPAARIITPAVVRGSFICTDRTRATKSVSPVTFW